MQKPNLARRLILAGLWALAMSTWGSIGHHLFGLPDAGPILVLVVVAAILAWPLPSTLSTRQSAHEQAKAT
jgi:hypothetical protein